MVARIIIVLTLLVSIDGMARERVGGRVEPRETRRDAGKNVRENRQDNNRQNTARGVGRNVQDNRQENRNQAVDVGQNIRDDRQDARRATAFTTARVVNVMKDDGTSEEMECCACPSSPAPANAMPLDTTPAY